eukprot:CAMPEP_0113697380 /NCGR_PEP_ID=MMETSP0038_2-20120614/22103_1 /TAXON_ID=2898 /ORGANISM="Cryptomonas paramecium" /LENGTH=111 /DNA_ID=CAMNT_0000620387 /DNA_START=8 /DNA_END=343 /DNA_ORIENTATION=+ /assembly_acc=CAM_ASM_000170
MTVDLCETCDDGRTQNDFTELTISVVDGKFDIACANFGFHNSMNSLLFGMVRMNLSEVQIGELPPPSRFQRRVQQRHLQPRHNENWSRAIIDASATGVLTLDDDWAQFLSR